MITETFAATAVTVPTTITATATTTAATFTPMLLPLLCLLLLVLRLLLLRLLLLLRCLLLLPLWGSYGATSMKEGMSAIFDVHSFICSVEWGCLIFDVQQFPEYLAVTIFTFISISMKI